MENVKEWYKSKTVWAALATMGTGLLLTFGIIDLSGEQEAITDNIMGVVETVIGLVALIGRIVAKTRITT